MGNGKAAPESYVDAYNDENASDPDIVDEFESSDSASDLEDVCFQTCICPNYPHNQRHCPENVRNRNRAMNLDDTVTPTCTLRTPPLKKLNQSLMRCPSPLISSNGKKQSTPVNIPLKEITPQKFDSVTSIHRKTKSTTLYTSQLIGSPPAVKDLHNESTAQNVISKIHL
uniref:Uncharacterized protein n=1 Tax=Amphimedon queenslandica TaxID=400682 RepID=A0A1X7TBS4_AMPQE